MSEMEETFKANTGGFESELYYILIMDFFLSQSLS